MHKLYFVVIIIFIFFQTNSIAQSSLGSILKKSEYKNTTYLQFTQNEFSSELESLLIEQGAKIKGKYTNGTIIISLPNNKTELVKEQIESKVSVPNSEIKISPSLERTGIVGVAITFFEDISLDEVKQIKSKYGIIDNEYSMEHKRIIIGNLNANQFEEIAALPYVSFISELMEEEPIPQGDEGAAYHHASVVVDTDGNRLTGDGVVVGVGDGGALGQHIDFEGRNINYATGTYSSFGDHGDKMCGIIGGAGNLNEKFQGYAPEATIVTQKTFRIFYYLPNYYESDEMVLTNNSYGVSFSCSNSGSYQYYSNFLDQQMNTYEDVLHMVAAGNYGGLQCESLPTGYKTVLSHFASAKNVLTVGGAMLDGTVWAGSSKGPVQDGRIKPEVLGLSEGLVATGNNYNYGGMSATSGATANVTGITTLLYEKYKKLNNDENPKGALIKAILCNTADDGGNPGPDYAYGFGIVNAKRAAQAIENQNYSFGQTTMGGETQSYTINVAEGQKELKVMLYWSDAGNAVYGSDALVNDLDVKVIAPDGTEYLPWVLDYINVQNNAVRDFDRINNIEQITLDAPMQGEYTIVVTTNYINTDLQKFVVTHDIIEEDLQLTYPILGESFEPSENIYISWEAAIDGATGYQLEYSTNNGTSWQMISNSIAASARNFTWTTPNINSEKVQVRITAQGTSFSSTSNHFNIFNSPNNFSANAICDNNVYLTWDAVENATAYEIYILGKEKMELLETVTEAELMIHEGLDIGVEYWFAVKALFPNGGKSRKTKAINTTPSGIFPCPWVNDVSLTNLNVGTIKKGRAYTSTSLSSRTFSFSITNVGSNILNSIPLEIKVGTNVFVEEVTQTVNPGETIVYTTNNTFDFTDGGIYDIEIKSTLEGENLIDNDVLNDQLIQLPNEPISIPNYFSTQNINDFYFDESEFGIENASHFDFNTTNNVGYFSTVTDEEEGNVFILNNSSDTESSEILMTYNLSGVGNGKTFIRYKVKAEGNSGTVVLSMRGSDTENWVDIETINTSGDWFSKDVNITPILNSNQTDLSSSTQFRLAAAGETTVSLREFGLLDQASLLPVELIYFKGNKIEENAILEWKTASEENNDYFEIQVAKGEEALQAGTFETLGRVEGNGTTVEEQLYTYLDTEKFKSGIRYYRLKQVDFDGAYEYSDIISIEFEEKPELDLHVYPNPVVAGDVPNVYFELPITSEVDFILTDVTGRVLKRIKRTFEPGSITISIEMDKNLAPGIYYLSGILGGTKEVVTKIVRVNE